jgi:hypothetical protein
LSDRKRENNKTWAWDLYEQGVAYNQNLTPNQYNLVETNTEFFIGNQWLNLPDTPAMRGLPKPVFNILKRVASLFIASLTSTGVALRFEPLAYYDGSNEADPDHDAAVFANAMVTTLLEKLKMAYRVRDALYDGAQTGDYCAHFWFDPDAKPYGGAFGNHRGEIQMELVDGINVMFGNPNDRRVETQPYIIVVGRDTVEHLQWLAKRYRKNKAARAYALEQTGALNDELDYLKGQLLNIAACTARDELTEIREELIRLRYIREQEQVRKAPAKTASRMIRYAAPSGTMLSVGKNNLQNERLIRTSEPDEIWLHAKGVPASHVILHTAKPTRDELYLAALIAAYHSDASASENVPVDYTQVRYVKKPSGARPGFVNYFHQHTLYVTPSLEAIAPYRMKEDK